MRSVIHHAGDPHPRHRGLLARLAGCGGGAETVENPLTAAAEPPDYTGAAPATGDVQSVQAEPVGEPQGEQPLRAVHTQAARRRSSRRTTSTWRTRR